MPSSFFKAQQGAAVLKHGFLSQYLPIFLNKLGQYAPDRRVAYIDAYAGLGEYEDGVPGSPLIAATLSAQKASSRTLDCIYIEEDDETAAALAKKVGAIKHEHIVLPGSAEDLLDVALRRAGAAPAFVFLDPFGLAMPFKRVVEILRRSAKTELLINFSLHGLWRHAGHFGATHAQSQTKVKRLNEALGDEEEWPIVWSEAREDENHKRDWTIVSQYMHRLVKMSRAEWQHGAVGVSDALDGSPVYYLLYFTQSLEGIWAFIESISNAREEFEYWTHARTRAPAPGQLSMPGMDWTRGEDAVDERYIAEIEQNIRLLLKAGPLSIYDHASSIFGSVLFLARKKHLRAAWDLLAAKSLVQERPKNTRIEKETIYPIAATGI